MLLSFAMDEKIILYCLDSPVVNARLSVNIKNLLFLDPFMNKFSDCRNFSLNIFPLIYLYISKNETICDGNAHDSCVCVRSPRSFVDEDEKLSNVKKLMLVIIYLDLRSICFHSTTRVIFWGRRVERFVLVVTVQVLTWLLRCIDNFIIYVNYGLVIVLQE